MGWGSHPTAGCCWSDSLRRWQHSRTDNLDLPLTAAHQTWQKQWNQLIGEIDKEIEAFAPLDLDHFSRWRRDNPGAVAVMEVIVWVNWGPVKERNFVTKIILTNVLGIWINEIGSKKQQLLSIGKLAFENDVFLNPGESIEINLISPSSVISPPQSWVTQSSRNPRLWLCLFFFFYKSFLSLIDRRVRLEVNPHGPHSGNRRRNINTTIFPSTLASGHLVVPWQISKSKVEKSTSCYLPNLDIVVPAAAPRRAFDVENPGETSHNVVRARRRYGPCAVERAPVLGGKNKSIYFKRHLTLSG